MKSFMKFSALFVAIGVICLLLLLESLPVILFFSITVHQDPQEGVTTDNVSSMMDNATLEDLDTTTLNCSLGFFINHKTGRCSPTCGVWEELPHNVAVVFKVARSLVRAFRFIGSIVALAMAVYNYKIVFKFPSILLVYFLLALLVGDIVFIINLAEQGSLLCQNSVDLTEIIEHPTPFCSFLGAVRPFILTMMSYWWFFHTISVFWKVWFPIHARQLKIRGHIKYIHIVVVMITLILSTIPIGFAFGTGGYAIYSLIPGLSSCITRNPDAYFYSYVLPLCILYAIGMTLIMLILWRILRMRQHLSGQGKSFRAETKLLCYLVYYSITTVIGLSFVTVIIKNTPNDRELFMEYFNCQSSGVDPDNPCVLEVNRLWAQITSLVFSILFMLAPYVTMIYIIPVDKFKEKWQIWTEKSRS